MSEQLGDRIRQARERANLTQEGLADLIGVSRETVGNWETGQTTPRNAMGRLQEVLGNGFTGTVSTPEDDQGVLLKLSPEAIEALNAMDPLDRQRAEAEAAAALLRVAQETRRRVDER